jgi:hypothetical protein
VVIRDISKHIVVWRWNYSVNNTEESHLQQKGHMVFRLRQNTPSEK